MPFENSTGTTGDLDIWNGWVTNDSLLTGTTASNTDSIIWRSWLSSEGTDTAITTDSTSDNAIWLRWTSDATAAMTHAMDQVANAAFQTGRAIEEITPHIEALRENMQRDRDAEAQRRRDAMKRARDTLHRFLDHQQKQQLQTQRFFEVVIGEAKRRYRVYEGRSGNVRLVDSEGREVASYCIHPAEYVPNEDTMLAQKLMLETDEDRFLRVANKTTLRRAA